MQLGTHPLFQRLSSFRNAKVFSKGKEVADDLRERWETSDSPFVHRIQVSASHTSILQPHLHVALWLLLYSLLFQLSERSVRWHYDGAVHLQSGQGSEAPGEAKCLRGVLGLTR